MDNPPRNIPKAIRNLEKSAEMEFATAQATLGMIYFAGIGVRKDPDIALKWSSKAAQSKIPLGMFYLGLAYAVGDGLSINDDFAVRWIRAAAERELTMAQLTLGMKLALGDGVIKNLELAVQWLRRATLNGSAEAALQLRKYENILLRLDEPEVNFSESVSVNQIASQALSSSLKVDNRDKFPNPSESSSFGSRGMAQDILNEPIPKIHLLRWLKNLLQSGRRKHCNQPFAGRVQARKCRSCQRARINRLQEERIPISNVLVSKASKFKHPESLRYLGILYFLGQGVEIDYRKAETWLGSSCQGRRFRSLKVSKDR